MQIPFGIQSYVHRSLNLSAQRMVNCYLERAPEGAKSQVANLQNYGIAALNTIGSGPLRDGIVVNGVPWVVSGGSLYTVASDGSGTLKGAANSLPTDGSLDMTSDGTQVLVVCNPLAILWNGSTLARITDTDFAGASRVEYLDGYAVVIEPGTGRFWIPESTADWSAWNALDFSTAEGWPDDTLDVIVDHEEAVLLGRETAEIWFNSGDPDFPLDRVPNGFIEKGVLCAGAAAKADNSLLFPGNDCIVYRLDGYTPVRVSTHAVEQWIEGLAAKVLRGFTWSEGGHWFYALTAAEGTYVLDLATGYWHERQSFQYANWRPLKILRAYDKWLVLDSTSNRIGYLDPNVFTEWGQPLRSSATAPSVANENRWVFHNRLELEFEQGVGNSGQGANPQIMLDWSDDGGRTWSAEKFLSLGKTGEFRKRAFIHRLGRARDRVYRYAISDPVRRTFIQANLEADIGER